MKTIVVIPARFGSTRFPGKPLASINGKPMVQWVYEEVKKCKEVDDVVIATDHEKIVKAVEEFNGKVVKTSDKHETGSDRIEEVTKYVEGDLFINVQGDEPLIRHQLVDEIAKRSKANPDMVITARTPLFNENDIDDPNVVKVVTGQEDNALYFSRSRVPYNRSKNSITYYKHLGIYSYPKEILQTFVKLPSSTLEKLEVLEQLRLLENGYKIKAIETSYDAIGVDTPEDIEKVEKILGGHLDG
ncbi:3-deoxy-manno-octulosonate cytidylyltransferase [Paraliobacillus ryukyuensis]|uniref:3-deoxy-manno-octulosonate cytidylyltransferase n=1 Tax=Paraliobacillus ryukyuensis TaxID=200904 RepID=UPI0009A7347B|nr:3-deoxy-manno-octulosonate cytidylyltransferase [Paraliobacillus ryukyuensis]